METKNTSSFEVNIDPFDAGSSVIALNGLSRNRRLVEAFKASLERQDDLLVVEEVVSPEGEISLQTSGLHFVSQEHAWPAVAYFLKEVAQDQGYDSVSITINDPGHKTSQQATSIPVNHNPTAA